MEASEVPEAAHALHGLARAELEGAVVRNVLPSELVEGVQPQVRVYGCQVWIVAAVDHEAVEEDDNVRDQRLPGLEPALEELQRRGKEARGVEYPHVVNTIERCHSTKVKVEERKIEEAAQCLADRSCGAEEAQGSDNVHQGRYFSRPSR